jgi:hypothetical protein
MGVLRRRDFLRAASALAICRATPAFAIFQLSDILTWQPLKVGGGGFTRDMDIAPDGTKVCKVDVYGAYVWNPNVPSTGNAGGMGLWQQLCKPGPIPPGDPAFNIVVSQNHFWGSQGAWDIRIAPSNSNVIYMLWDGMMYKSTNKGVTFVNQTKNAGGTFPLQTRANGGSNSSANGSGPMMAIDPQNPNVCWAGNFAGIFYTQNGGRTWSTLSTSLLPVPTGNVTYGFAFDPLSAVTGGMTQGIYCTVNSVGIYYSSNAGASWTLLSGGSFSGTMPTTFYRVVVDKFGVAWVCAQGSNNMWNFTVHTGTAFAANTWTHSGATASGEINSVATDPASTSSATQRVITSGYNGFSLCQTTNGGATWTPSQGSQFNQVATDIPWLQTNELYMTSGCMKFDPSQTNALYMPEGIGVWYCNPPTIGSNATWPAWTWNSQTAGIESLETTYIISPPGGGVGLVQWDRNWFLITDRTKFPTIYGTWPGNRQNNNQNQSVIWGGNGADWAGQHPNFIFLGGAEGNTAGQQTGSGYSTNGGVPVTGWSFFANQPPGLGAGQGAAGIAISADVTSIGSASMMRVSNGLYATMNGGATPWTNVTPSGSSGWTNGYAQTANQLAADKVTPNYYVAIGGGGIIYYSSNTGASWTAVTPRFSFGTSNGGNPQIKAIPNNAGHYFLTGGFSFGATVDKRNIFYRSTDGGKTWRDVSQASFTVREVWVWGFGAPNGGTYPTIFIYGYVNSVLGVWQSTDNCVTWQKIGDTQFGGMTFDLPQCMAGDMNIPGVVYVGFFGSGYLQYSS